MPVLEQCRWQALASADEIRDILARGGDPFIEMEERQALVERKTFGQCADDMLLTMVGTWRNPKREAQWGMTLGDAYCSTLRRRPVDEIDTAAVVAVLEPHWRDKHETASRLSPIRSSLVRSRKKSPSASAMENGFRTASSSARPR